ncbi:MAG: TIGR00266 family protein [Firmicutes bacterium]|nr:TIGR00266 family protein [Bacillota bacterium]
MKYQIVGEPLPVVICDMEQGETMITEKGAMSWMSPNMRMETQGTGGLGKMMGRMFSGESMFQNRYTAEGGPGQIAFASSFPGTIKALEIAPGQEYVVQKRAFLASDETVELSVFFQKKFGAGLFGGEGFIMQKLSGHGTAFIEIDGYTCEYNLQEGQQMKISTGFIAMMDSTCSMDIQSVGGAKNALLGGEGFFNTVVTGPGKVILQTMPINSVARAIQPFIVTGN